MTWQASCHIEIVAACTGNEAREPVREGERGRCRSTERGRGREREGIMGEPFNQGPPYGPRAETSL